MTRVLVVGAGVAGLAAAWQLVSDDPDVEVLVLEQSDRVGGKLRTGSVGGAALDVGAESVLARRPEALDLITEVGVAERLVHPAAVGADVVHDGRRVPLPRGTLMGVPGDLDGLTSLFTAAEIERMRHEPTGSPLEADISVGRLVDDRLGRAVTDRLVEPLLAGVYAGDARQISAEAAVPALHAAARSGVSLRQAVTDAMASAAGAARPVFASLDGGLGTLPELVGNALRAKGVQIRTGCTVRALRRAGQGWVLTHGPTVDEREEEADAVVLAVPAAPAARLLASAAPDAAKEVGGIGYASVALVTYAFDGRPHPLEGRSGFLVPPSEPVTIKASTFSSVKWPWLAAAHPDRSFVRVSFGRFGDVRPLQRTDEELARVGLADLRGVLAADLPAPLDWSVQRWGGGLPQYLVGHRDRVASIREELPGGLAVCGAAYDGVGIPACIASGRQAAGAVLTHVRDAAARLT